MLRRQRIKRTGPDRFRVNLPGPERDVLRDLLPQLRGLLAEPPMTADERMRRVFPTAYATDPELDAEYQRFMREELVTSHTAAIDRVIASIDRTELTEAELLSWTQSINSIRLVLGTMLDVSEDGSHEDPSDPGYALYAYLSGILEELVGALSA